MIVLLIAVVLVYLTGTVVMAFLGAREEWEDDSIIVGALIWPILLAIYPWTCALALGKRARK